MVLDIVDCHNKDILCVSLSPSYSWLVRVALRHVVGKDFIATDSRFRGAEEQFRRSLEWFLDAEAPAEERKPGPRGPELTMPLLTPFSG